MKKLLMVLAFVGLAAYASAQTSVPEQKYSVATNSFWSNWFIQANGTWSAFYYNEPVLVAPFHKFPGGSYYTGIGASLALGKWFTPGLGLRTKINAWQAGKEESGFGGNKYWTANEQVLFNLSNLFCGYNEKRVWNVIPFIGAGINRDMTANHYSTQLSAGILNTFRLGRVVSINAELGWNSWESGNTGLGLKDRVQQFMTEVGLTFNLGKATWAKTPDVDALMAMNKEQMDALNASLRDAQNENARLKALLAQKKEVAPTTQTVVKKELATTKQSVFFNIGRSKIASRKDLVNVQEVANYAKQNGGKIVVTGYADSKTGTPAFNQKLSERRAETVANELVKMGVSRDNIEVKAAGGVNDLSPISYNRRATVELK